MGHATWQELVCDECGHPANYKKDSSWGHLVRNSDAEDFLNYWRNEGWVYDEDSGKWLCPECAKKHNIKG